jgi:protein-disulfide isomerase
MKYAIIFCFLLLMCLSCTNQPDSDKPGNHAPAVLDAHILGSGNAPIEIIEYSDFECPYSKLFFNDILPNLTQDYISTKKAKLIFKNLPLNSVHPNAHKAAEAAECAAEQGRFWEMHDILFRNGVGGGIEAFRRYAVSISLDMEKFNTCLDTNSTRQKVIDDFYRGIDSGVKGTPTFFINGKMAPTMKNYEEFKEYLDSLEINSSFSLE